METKGKVVRKKETMKTIIYGNRRQPWKQKDTKETQYTNGEERQMNETMEAEGNDGNTRK